MIYVTYMKSTIKWGMQVILRVWLIILTLSKYIFHIIMVSVSEHNDIMLSDHAFTAQYQYTLISICSVTISKAENQYFGHGEEVERLVYNVNNYISVENQ